MLGSLGTDTNITLAPATGVNVPFTAGNVTLFGWCPTYRTIAPNLTAYNRRNRTVTYYRGFKENVELYLQTGSPVQWRRIVVGSNLNVVNTSSYSTADPQFYGRTQTPQQSSYYAFLEVIMQGASGTDWNNAMSAKLDAKRVTIYYDKTRTISPQTASGKLCKFKMWHSINKQLTYDDEEVGGGITTSGWAANEPPNHNVYVMDLFASVNPTTNQMSFATQATSYWHER